MGMTGWPRAVTRPKLVVLVRSEDMESVKIRNTAKFVGLSPQREWFGSLLFVVRTENGRVVQVTTADELKG